MLLGELCIRLNSCQCQNVLKSGNVSTTENTTIHARNYQVSLIEDPIDTQSPVENKFQNNKKHLTTVCCDFQWELNNFSSSLICFSPRSAFLSQKHLNLNLQLSCVDSKFERNTDQEQWLHKLKNIVCSNTVVCQNNNCEFNISTTKSVEKEIRPNSESDKPKLPPRKPRSKSGDSPKPAFEKDVESKRDTTKGSKKEFYKDSKTEQDIVKAYIEADKLEREQRVFR